jgi:hypothetical protein
LCGIDEGLSFTIATVRSWLIFVLMCACGVTVAGQTAPEPQSSQPEVQYNVVNVCSLKADERALLEKTFARIPAKPSFSPEYEIARGRAGGDVEFPLGEGAEQKAAKPKVYARWVRIRREFPDGAALLNAQYSLSASDDDSSEVLVLRLRDAQDVMMLSISASAGGMAPAKMVAAGLPAEHIRMERFGKASITLARCPGADQSAYEPLFTSATQLLRNYKTALRVVRLVPGELAGPGFASESGKGSHATGGGHTPQAKPAPAKSGH